MQDTFEDSTLSVAKKVVELYKSGQRLVVLKIWFSKYKDKKLSKTKDSIDSIFLYVPVYSGKG